jgi:hypothetical protein
VFANFGGQASEVKQWRSSGAPADRGAVPLRSSSLPRTFRRENRSTPYFWYVSASFTVS